MQVQKVSYKPLLTELNITSRQNFRQDLIKNGYLLSGEEGMELFSQRLIRENILYTYESILEL